MYRLTSFQGSPKPYLLQTPLNGEADTLSIEGEGRLSSQLINKIMMKEKANLPAPDEVFPIEPLHSRIEDTVPEQPNKCSMPTDELDE